MNDTLERVYEDLKISFIHKESITLNVTEIEAILDILDKENQALNLDADREMIGDDVDYISDIWSK